MSRTVPSSSAAAVASPDWSAFHVTKERQAAVLAGKEQSIVKWLVQEGTYSGRLPMRESGAPRDLNLLRQSQQADQFRLPAGAGLGKDRLQLNADRIGFDRQRFRDRLDGLPSRHHGGDAGFGGRQIKQRLQDFGRQAGLLNDRGDVQQ